MTTHLSLWTFRSSVLSCYLLCFQIALCLTPSALFYFFCFAGCNNNMNSLVLSLAPKFINLQTLILRQDKPELEDNAVDAIENHCHELQELDLSKSLKLSDRSLYALSHSWFLIKKLKIDSFFLCVCVCRLLRKSVWWIYEFSLWLSRSQGPGLVWLCSHHR